VPGSGVLVAVPLLALPFFSLTYGMNTSLSVTAVVLLFAMYSAVGFMEEIIFRGLMFKGLAKQWNRYVVVVFISLTFAVGHIVSMVAVAQSGSDTVLQVVNAGVVGFMFMAVILASGNLTICVIAHILYNFLANISFLLRLPRFPCQARESLFRWWEPGTESGRMTGGLA
jgi:membrane protease YdiL (CAAX protease family)